MARSHVGRKQGHPEASHFIHDTSGHANKSLAAAASQVGQTAKLSHDSRSGAGGGAAGMQHEEAEEGTAPPEFRASKPFLSAGDVVHEDAALTDEECR